MTRRESTVVSAALLAVTASTALLSLLDVTGPLRLAVTVAFFLLVPGWSVVAFFRPGTSSITWALVVAVSVGIDLIVGQIMLVTGQWRPALASAAVLAVCAALLVTRLVTAGRLRGGTS